MEITNVEIVDEGEIECINSTGNPIICSKILHHFVKGKISCGYYISYTRWNH